MKPKLLFYANSALLEGPCWDPKEEVLYCVSIEQHLIYRIHPQTGYIKSYETEGPVGCVVVESNGFLLSAEKKGLFQINPKTGERNFLFQPEPDESMRYNDGKLDPNGRFLFGTMGFLEEKPGKACLYTYDKLTCKILVEGITISNGIGFSKQGATMYYIDTPTKKVGMYHYDLERGEANFEKHIIHIPGKGFPDGMCVDIDDTLWVAEWGGGKVCKWDPSSEKKLSEIHLPCERVTSCCLGGKNLDHLYITTAKNPKKQESMAGGLFQVKIR